MKKTVIGIFVLSLFLLSLAATASAENRADKPVDAAKIQQKIQERAQKINDSDITKFNANLEFKARALTKIKVEKARSNFLKAKENFLAARLKYQATQQKFSEIKDKVKECQSSENSTCNQYKDEIKEKAKEHLINSADAILEHLNKLKSRVEENEDLTEEEANEILAKIEEQIASVEQAKAVIETSNSKEEIKEAVKTLKEAWLKIKDSAKIHSGQIVNARIGGIIVKSEQLTTKLQKIIERMEADGKNTTAISPLIDEFNSLIGDAKTSYNAAIAKFNEAKQSDQVNTEFIRE